VSFSAKGYAQVQAPVQVAANAAVALAWRLPLLQGLMARNFTHLPGSGRSRTLLTSVFSHRGLLHLTVGFTMSCACNATGFHKMCATVSAALRLRLCKLCCAAH
jgi:hypothetical protein